MALFTESKWRTHDVEMLIQLLSAYPVLWDSNNHNYKNPKARDAAFNLISQKVKMPVVEVRKKYRILRSQYIREVRLRRNGSGTNWSFFEALKFLSTGQANREIEHWHELLSEDTQDYKEEMLTSAETAANIEEENDLEQCSVDYLEDYTCSTADSVYKIDENSQTPKTKKRRVEAELKRNSFSDKSRRSQSIMVMKQPEKLRDEYTILGEHVACELRSLKNQPALLKSLKCSILQAILEANKALSS